MHVQAKVIVCTDGLSNVGVGALSRDSTDMERTYARGFFHRAAEYAVEVGVCVSVISIEVCVCGWVRAWEGGGRVELRCVCVCVCVRAWVKVVQDRFCLSSDPCVYVCGGYCCECVCCEC